MKSNTIIIRALGALFVSGLRENLSTANAEATEHNEDLQQRLEAIRKRVAELDQVIQALRAFGNSGGPDPLNYEPGEHSPEAELEGLTRHSAIQRNWIDGIGPKAIGSHTKVAALLAKAWHLPEESVVNRVRAGLSPQQAIDVARAQMEADRAAAPNDA